jgi:acetolactate synthase I/II/III large subunit
MAGSTEAGGAGGLAGSRSGADEVVAALADAGVDHIFGLPGTTIMDILDALARQDEIRYITVRHEQVAGFMADGYARASGNVGVCLASRGPGAANLAIAVHNADAESVPVLAVVGQVGDDIAARPAFEEIDLLTMFGPMTKWAVEVHDTGRIRELATRAVRVAADGRPAPVLLSLPLDVQQRPAAVAAPGQDTAGRLYRPAADPAAADLAARLLAGAERPVLIVGGGVAGDRARAALAAVAAAADAPVVTTWLRKSQFPNDDPHYVGALGYGAHPVAEAAVREADVILAVGCRFSEFTTRRWTLVPPAAAVIHVDVDAEQIGRTVPVAVGIQADAALAAEAIAAALGPAVLAGGVPAGGVPAGGVPAGGVPADGVPADGAPADGVPADGVPAVGAPAVRDGVPARDRSPRATRLRELRARYEQESVPPASTPSVSPVPSGALVAELQAAVDRHRALLVQDVHTFGPWIARYLRIREPGSYFGAAGGSMGWGLPAAMGIQAARPDRTVLAVLGDGSFWMVAQDLETAVREQLPVVCVVVNNFAFGNTRDRQRLAHGGRYLGVFYENPDFAAYARLLGAHGERVDKSGDLAGAIDRAVASGRPAVIDVIQDQQEGLPPGMEPPSAKPETR